MASHHGQRRAAEAIAGAGTTSPSPRSVRSAGIASTGISLPGIPSSGVACLALLLTACTVGPGYQRPSTVTPASFRDQGTMPSASSAADLPWWSVFKDPALKNLLSEAIANNQDLAIALARVEEARATAGVVRADRMPQVQGDAGVARSRGSRELGSGFFGPRTTNDYRATISASWELDLWGRVANAEEAAYADWLASIEGQRAALVTLVGDVGEAYFDLRELDLELEITKRTLDTRQKTSDLFAKRLAGGVSNNLEMAQATADLAAAAAATPEVEKRIVQQENLLGLLLGRTPSPIARGSALGTQDLPPEVPVGMPSALLERRPDVRAAEEGVRAANARVGVAMADFFPRINLAALVGVDSGDLTHFIDEKASLASVGAGLTAPIFQGGRLESAKCVAIAQWERAIAQYRKSVQASLRDVSDQLVAIKKTRETRVELEKAVEALTEAVKLSSSRYENGVSAYFEVLDAQRRLFPAEIELARTKRDQYVALVRLYRALGGGWHEPTDGPPAPIVRPAPPVPAAPPAPPPPAVPASAK